MTNQDQQSDALKLQNSAQRPASSVRRVGVVETRHLLREGYLQLFDDYSEIEVIVDADNTNEITKFYDEKLIDTVLIGIHREHHRGLRHVSAFVRSMRDVTTIALHDTDAPTAEQLLDAGFDGAVSVDAGAENLKVAISSDARTIKKRTNSPAPGLLTKREMQILSLVSDGLTSESISKQLGISRSTVANHKERIFDKLHAKNQAHAVARAVAVGIIKPKSQSNRSSNRQAV